LHGGGESIFAYCGRVAGGEGGGDGVMRVEGGRKLMWEGSRKRVWGRWRGKWGNAMEGAAS
jgi:hypothetical protein